jgi:YD repeat-containing protein
LTGWHSPFNSCSWANSVDANGNLIEKTDARNIKITYGYDALNRNTTVDYDNTAVNPDITSRSYWSRDLKFPSVYL